MMHPKKPKAILPLIFLFASLGFATPTVDLPFGAWKRA